MKINFWIGLWTAVIAFISISYLFGCIEMNGKGWLGAFLISSCIILITNLVILFFANNSKKGFYKTALPILFVLSSICIGINLYLYLFKVPNQTGQSIFLAIALAYHICMGVYLTNLARSQVKALPLA